MSARRPLLIAALVAVSVSATGCGGRGTSATTTVTSVRAGALAFARCMRAHGVPGWPDPTSAGLFDKTKLRQLDLSTSRARALEQGPCKNLLSSGPPPPTITPADRADYLRATACMRSHGYPAFPDPTFQNNTVTANVPSTIDQDSRPFKAVAAICTKLIPAGLPYSSRSAGH